MEAKGSTFLKVTGILMIVFGVIALVVSISPFSVSPHLQLLTTVHTI